jgi:hypothetical protein
MYVYIHNYIYTHMHAYMSMRSYLLAQICLICRVQTHVGVFRHQQLTRLSQQVLVRVCGYVCMYVYVVYRRMLGFFDTSS